MFCAPSRTVPSKGTPEMSMVLPSPYSATIEYCTHVLATTVTQYVQLKHARLSFALIWICGAPADVTCTHQERRERTTLRRGPEEVSAELHW